MNKGVGMTLRELLFDRPAPPAISAKEYAEFAPLMFPVREEFIRLLDSEEANEEQIDAAKRILLALAYEAPVFPPNKFIRNLLDFESRVAGEAAGGGHVARDHFVHLVNLYLIGLYIFWYHSPLHRDVCQQLKKSLPSGASRDKRSVRRAVISAWRSFVLFHDLGYPLEAAGQVADATNELSPFTNATDYLAKDSALFVLSQLIALEGLISEEQSTLGEVIEDLGPVRRNLQVELALEPRNWPDEKARLRDAVKIRDLGDFTAVRLAELIVGREGLIPVLETISDDHPCASASPTLNQFLQARSRSKPIHHSQIETWAAEFQLPREEGAHFRLTFYAMGFDKAFEDFLKRVFQFDASDLEEPNIPFRHFARNLLVKRPPDPPNSSNPRFAEFAFAVYEQLLETLDFDDLDRVVQHAIELGWTLSTREYSGLQRIVLTEVTTAIRKRLTEHARVLEQKGDADIAQIGLDAYLTELLAVLHDPELPKSLRPELSAGLSDRVALKTNLYRFYRALRDTIAKQAGDPLLCFSQQSRQGRKSANRPVPYAVSAKIGVLKREELGRLTEALLIQRGIPGLQALQQYAPSYFSSARALGLNPVDHGIASGLLFATVHRALRLTLKDAPIPLQGILGLRGGVYSGDLEAPRPELGEQFASEILYTIFVHNLYPGEFTDANSKKFRTTIRSGAFAFFALFCDNLQHWDRRSLMNQARGLLPYGTNSSRFDVKVVNNRFQITERGPKVEVTERQRRLRGQLDDFLEGASRLIDLNLAEW